jgi:Tol biopolymer transport system component
MVRKVASVLAVVGCTSALCQSAGPRSIVFVQEHARVVGGSTIWRPDIWTVNTDGSSLKRLSVDSTTDPPGYSNDPAWSPDGTKLVFVSEQAGSQEGDLYVMDAVDSNGDLEGDNRTVLLTSPGEQYSPYWAPDGATVTFVEEQAPTADLLQLKYPPSGPPTALVTGPEGDLEQEHSPDSTRLVYVRGTSNSSRQIVVRTLATGSEQSLTPKGIHQSPSFSPDGSRLVFSSAMQGNHIEIYVMDAVDGDGDGFGDNLLRLTNTPPNQCSGQPKWSPDGTQILFTHFPNAISDPLGRDVYVMDASGAGATAVTTNHRSHSGRWKP